MLPETRRERNGRHTNSETENRNRRIHLRRIRGGLKMADHLRAFNASKTITIQIASDGGIRINIQGFRRDVCNHVSNEYYEKTRYICERYCPEIMEA